MVDQISSRKEHSLRVRSNAETLLANRIGEWGDAKEIAKRVCIYTTGSFGRNDASTHSDLDVFIVSLEEEGMMGQRLLTRLEEVELLASIVHVNRELDLPELDGDGGFLKVHCLSDYLVGLGKPSDDADNTFTGRLLLLLESKPIFGNEAYEKVLQECISRYWIDYADHSDSFLPAFLVNDILRFWRTLCVNYEAGSMNAPEKRRAKNYKLKYSRLLTCFSAILALQMAFRSSGSISSNKALEILNLSPLERVNFCRDGIAPKLADSFEKLISLYEGFLKETDCSKSDLYAKMSDPAYYKTSLDAAREFGDAMYELLRGLAEDEDATKADWRFFRYLAI